MKKCIEIELGDDGTFTVAECEPKEEMAEQPVPGLPPEQEEVGGQTFQNIDQALQAAKQLLMQTPEGMEQEQQAQAGFDSVHATQKRGMM